MKRKITIAFFTVLLTAACTVPAFAHGHNHSSRYSHHQAQENCITCEATCEDGVTCGIDGHYCEEHREEDHCTGQTNDSCRPDRNHHHHKR